MRPHATSMRSTRSPCDLHATPTRSVRDLRDLLATCSQSICDLHATCAIWARSGRDLGAICVRSCLEPWCVRLSAGRRISPNVAEVVDCSRLLPSAKSLSPTKVTQQSYQKVCFEQFGSGTECRQGVAAMSQGVADVAVVSQRCRDSVARCRSDVAMVSPDVAVVSRWCRECRGAVTRRRHDDFFKYTHGVGGSVRSGAWSC